MYEKMKTRRNVSLQIFRILACFGVFLVHFGQRVQFEGIIRQYTDFGQFGVQMFFIVSGLLAAKGLDGRDNYIMEYYKKRFISIAPTYYFVILYFFITENLLELVYPHIPDDPIGLGWFRYLFMLTGFTPFIDHFWSNFWCNLGGTWTIPVFAFFYLVAPFVMKFVKGYKSAIVLLIIVFGASCIGYRLYPCTVLGNIHYFFIGVLVYFCRRDRQSTLCVLGFLIVVIGGNIIGRPCYSLIFAAMISISLEKETVLPDRIQRFVDIIDEHSYALYLTHCLVFCSIIDRFYLVERHLFVIPLFATGIIAVVLTIATTVIVHRFIEKPIQSVLKKNMLMYEK